MGHIPFLYLPGPWEGDTIPLSPEQLHHLAVLRGAPGSPLEYSDGKGTVGRGRFEGDHVGREKEVKADRVGPRLSVGVAPIRSRDRLRFLVEKAAEVGLDRLVWLTARRGQASPPSRDKAHSWAVAALEQSRAPWLMEVAGPSKPQEIGGEVWVADPKGAPLGEVAEAATLLVGPEGGWEEEEIAGLTTVRLGPSVLRTETAVIVAAVLLAEKSGRLGSSPTR